MHSESTNPRRRTRRRFGAIVCILRTSRLGVLSAPDESLLSAIIPRAFECLQELRISFLCVFLLLPSLSFGFLLLFFSLGFALSALCVLIKLVLVDLLLLWCLVSVMIECTGERELGDGHCRTGRVVLSSSSSSSSSSKKAASLDFVLSMM